MPWRVIFHPDFATEASGFSDAVRTEMTEDIKMPYAPVEAGDWIASQPETVRDAGEARGRDLIRKATLRDVRRTVNRTQAEVAAAMGVSQDRVSRLEHSEDALISTLRRHARALGGELRLTVEFPDRTAIAIELTSGDAASEAP